MNQFTYRQPDVNRLVSQLRIKVLPKYRKMSQPEGLQGRLDIMRKIVTALFKYERLELRYSMADEARGYAERVNPFLLNLKLIIFASFHCVLIHCFPLSNLWISKHFHVLLLFSSK